MKKTIIYHDTYKEDIPCTVDEMRLVSATPINNKRKEYECVYRSLSTYELAESIAQKRNKEALERIKPLTIGYTGKIIKGKPSYIPTDSLLKWGGEGYEERFIDDFDKKIPHRTFEEIFLKPSGEAKGIFKSGKGYRVLLNFRGFRVDKRFVNYQDAVSCSRSACSRIEAMKCEEEAITGISSRSKSESKEGLLKNEEAI